MHLRVTFICIALRHSGLNVAVAKISATHFRKTFCPMIGCALFSFDLCHKYILYLYLYLYFST